MNQAENITLVVTCNDHFALMLGALIQSIIKNHHSSSLIDLYVVDDHISKINKLKITDCAGDSCMNLIWLDSETIFEDIKLPIDNSSFPRNVYMRLFIPSFLPKNILKAIYLDVDMICCTDISDLWEIELGKYPAAAVKDRSGVVSNQWGAIPNYKELGMHPDTPYFNTGMIVFNMEVWRQENISHKIIKAVEDNIKHAHYPDQYGFNAILAGRSLSLDFRWNCYSMLNRPDPYIIHFIGNKPIYQSYADNPEYGKIFFKYLGMTPWRKFKPYSAYRRYWNKILIKIANKLQAFK